MVHCTCRGGSKISNEAMQSEVVKVGVNQPTCRIMGIIINHNSEDNNHSMFQIKRSLLELVDVYRVQPVCRIILYAFLFVLRSKSEYE